MPARYNGKASFEELFWSYVNKEGPLQTELELTPCWLWTGYKNHDGYGRISMNGRLVMAHRIVLKFVGQFVSVNKEIDHLCRNRACVNPVHLEVVTHKKNMERGVTKASLKTHCDKGHPLSGPNLYVPPDGQRVCRACKRERRKKSSELKRTGLAPLHPKTRCKNGHALTPDNVYIRPGTTHRTCKECRRINRYNRQTKATICQTI